MHTDISPLPPSNSRGSIWIERSMSCLSSPCRLVLQWPQLFIVPLLCAGHCCYVQATASHSTVLPICRPCRFFRAEFSCALWPSCPYLKVTSVYKNEKRHPSFIGLFSRFSILFCLSTGLVLCQPPTLHLCTIIWGIAVHPAVFLLHRVVLWFHRNSWAIFFVT